MVCYCEHQPVDLDICLDLQELLGSRNEALNIAELHLDVAEIPGNAAVLGIKPQSVQVALLCLLIIAVVAVQQAIDMPTKIRLHVGFDGCLGQVVSLRLAVRVAV